MKTKNCKVIRRSIEETEPGEQPAATMAHVRECMACLEFFEQDMKLRRLVGSLSPVDAPADFDFRLRARIANDRIQLRRRSGISNWSFAIPTITLAGLVLVTGLVFLSSKLKSPERAAPIGAVPMPADSKPVAEPALQAAARHDPADRNDESAQKPVLQIRKLSPVARKQFVGLQRGALEIKDSSAVGASVLRQKDGVSDSQIPLSFPLQTLTVSVDDESGVSRTISFPTVSFGSQRVLTNVRSGSNLPAKGSW